MATIMRSYLYIRNVCTDKTGLMNTWYPYKPLCWIEKKIFALLKNTKGMDYWEMFHVKIQVRWKKTSFWLPVAPFTNMD